MKKQIIKYKENKNDIIQTVEIDLSEIVIKIEINKYKKHIDKKYRNIFKYNVDKKLIYKTEALIPKVNKKRINLLLVLGNPAVHSVAERMPFSYEKTRSIGKWKEHRFWKALRDCEVLKFNKILEKPNPKNIVKINDYKRNCLLKGNYISDFNIFLLPYFSFPTPASEKYNGVDGIKKIFGKYLFNEMKKFEFQRFKNIVLNNKIKNIICFQKLAINEIKQDKYKQIGKILNNPDYEIYNVLKNITLYTALPTRYILTNKGKSILKNILFDIKRKNKID